MSVLSLAYQILVHQRQVVIAHLFLSPRQLQGIRVVFSVVIEILKLLCVHVVRLVDAVLAKDVGESFRILSDSLMVARLL